MKKSLLTLAFLSSTIILASLSTKEKLYNKAFNNKINALHTGIINEMEKEFKDFVIKQFPPEVNTLIKKSNLKPNSLRVFEFKEDFVLFYCGIQNNRNQNFIVQVMDTNNSNKKKISTIYKKIINSINNINIVDSYHHKEILSKKFKELYAVSLKEIIEEEKNNSKSQQALTTTVIKNEKQKLLKQDFLTYEN